MPYIPQNQRINNESKSVIPETPGDLNYLFTYYINGYLIEKGLSYQTINDVLGALEGAKLEFNRRIVVPYENQKILENGDVYNTRGENHGSKE